MFSFSFVSKYGFEVHRVVLVPGLEPVSVARDCSPGSLGESLDLGSAGMVMETWLTGSGLALESSEVGLDLGSAGVGLDPDLSFRGWPGSGIGTELDYTVACCLEPLGMI